MDPNLAKDQPNNSNYSYLQLLHHNLPNLFSDQAANTSLTDLTHKNQINSLLPDKILSEIANNGQITILYHDYIYGTGQSQQLCRNLNKCIHNNSLKYNIRSYTIQNKQSHTQLTKLMKCKQQNNKQDIIYIDLYCGADVTILPILYGIKNNLILSNIIIYSHSTNKQLIQSILNQQQCNQIQYSYEMPNQITSNDLFNQLMAFLQQNTKHQQKDFQDVVIFKTLTKQFIHKINHSLRINGLYSYCRIVCQQELNSNQFQQGHQCKIFIAQNTHNLLKLINKTEYTLDKVYLVLDYGLDRYTYYDYELCCFVEQHNVQANYQQRIKRMNLLGGKISQYVYDQQVPFISLQASQSTPIKGYQNSDIGNYYLLMKYLQLSHELPTFNSQMTKILLTFQKMIQQIDHKHIPLLIDSSTYLPITAVQIQSSKNKISSEIQNLDEIMILIYAIWTSNNLQQRIKMSNEQPQYEFQEANTVVSKIDYKKPGSIWMQSGYLQCALDLVIKLNTLQNRYKDDHDFSFQAYKEKFQFKQQVYREIISKFRHYKNIYGIQSNNLHKYQLTDNDFSCLLESLVEKLQISVRFFSGSRRLGYFQKGRNQGYLLSKQSLTSQLNQRPSFIFTLKILKFINQSGQKTGQIVLSNNISDEIMLTAYGSLGNQSKQSFGEAQIQFHNISSSVISHLNKYNGVQLQNFQKQYECSIQVNQDMGMIGIQCSKKKQSKIRQIFGELLGSLKNQFHKQSKILNFSKTLKVIMGSGAQIQDLIVKENNEKQFGVIDVGIVRNVSKDATLEDLKDLFDQFVHVKEITVIDKPQNKEAILSFFSHQDYRRFYQCFQGCEYLGSVMYIEPYNYVSKVYKEQNYILFEWNAWKSTGEGYIQFQSEVAAKCVQKQLKVLNVVDSSSIQMNRIDRTIYLSKMRTVTDQKFLYASFIPYGKITKIQVKRSHFSQTLQNQTTVVSFINRAFKGDSVNFTVDPILRGKNGYRSSKIHFQTQQYQKQAYFLFNQILGLGKSRLYATLYFTYPIKINQNDKKYLNVYKTILQQISQTLNRPQMFDLDIIRQIGQTWIIVKSNEEAELEIVKNMFFEALKGKKLSLKYEQHSKLMTEFALKSIQDLQKKYPCKIFADFNTKSIMGLGRSNMLAMVQKQINTKLLKSFTCSMQLYNKAYRYIDKNLKQIKQQIDGKNLDSIQLQNITKSIVLKGKIDYIQKSKEKLGKIIQKIGKNVQKNQDEQACGICAESHVHPYKLQACGHKFCFECLEQTIDICSKDISMYPLKCPQCLQKIYICDLNNIVSPSNWKQIQQISINAFVGLNSDSYIFCFTAQCPQVNKIELASWFRCRQCKKGYCLKCKNQYHPGITCQEARYGSDKMFDQFMKSVGGRICPKKTCKAPLWRISGCMKVQCAKCKSCICFKCPPDKMAYFSNASETYDHLSKVHGGCF